MPVVKIFGKGARVLFSVADTFTPVLSEKTRGRIIDAKKKIMKNRLFFFIGIETLFIPLPRI
jgi:hypothetical protein